MRVKETEKLQTEKTKIYGFKCKYLTSKYKQKEHVNIILKKRQHGAHMKKQIFRLHVQKCSIPRNSTSPRTPHPSSANITPVYEAQRRALRHSKTKETSPWCRFWRIRET